jgi:3-hydroxybutyrate dehydrogenase
MLKETGDGEFSTFDDVAQTFVFLADFPSNSLASNPLLIGASAMART